MASGKSVAEALKVLFLSELDGIPCVESMYFLHLLFCYCLCINTSLGEFQALSERSVVWAAYAVEWGRMAVANGHP